MYPQKGHAISRHEATTSIMTNIKKKIVYLNMAYKYVPGYMEWEGSGQEMSMAPKLIGHIYVP